MIIVIGSVVIRDGQHDAALATAQAHVQRSRAEPGCLAHAVHIDSENPQRLVFVEEWADRAALDAHFRVPASRAFICEIGALAAAVPEMRVFDATVMPLREG